MGSGCGDWEEKEVGGEHFGCGSRHGGTNRGDNEVHCVCEPWRGSSDAIAQRGVWARIVFGAVVLSRDGEGLAGDDGGEGVDLSSGPGHMQVGIPAMPESV